MSARDGAASFLSCRADVCKLLEAGKPMAEVERTIDAYPLERDQKDALWLWAHGRRERPLGHASHERIIGRRATH